MSRPCILLLLNADIGITLQPRSSSIASSSSAPGYLTYDEILLFPISRGTVFPGFTGGTNVALPLNP